MTRSFEGSSERFKFEVRFEVSKLLQDNLSIVHHRATECTKVAQRVAFFPL